MHVLVTISKNCASYLFADDSWESSILAKVWLECFSGYCHTTSHTHCSQRAEKILGEPDQPNDGRAY